MRLLRVGFLALLLSVLLTAAVVGGYGRDQQVIRMFHGTGIAGKLDVWGPQPNRVVIENQASGVVMYADVDHDGTFVAQLPPGSYRVRIPGDSRAAIISVPDGECTDVVLDYRIPLLVLTIPG